MKSKNYTVIRKEAVDNFKGPFHSTAHVQVMAQAKSLLLFTDQSKAICQNANPAHILAVSWNFRVR